MSFVIPLTFQINTVGAWAFHHVGRRNAKKFYTKRKRDSAAPDDANEDEPAGKRPKAKAKTAPAPKVGAKAGAKPKK